MYWHGLKFSYTDIPLNQATMENGNLFIFYESIMTLTMFLKRFIGSLYGFRKNGGIYVLVKQLLLIEIFFDQS